MNVDTNGWEVIRHPDDDGVRSLAHDEGGCLICYDEGPLSPAQMRNLAAALLRAADEAESGVSEEARLRLELAAVDDALREAGIEHPLGARGVRDLASLYELAKNPED